MTRPTTLVTAAELLRMPEEGVRHELVRGELRVYEPTGGTHGAPCTRLVVAITRHVDEHRAGTVLTEATGFHLRSDPDSVRAPCILGEGDALEGGAVLPGLGVPVASLFAGLRRE